MLEPLVYMNKDKETGKKWKRRAVSCIDKCSTSLLQEFESRRWKAVTKFKKVEELKVWDATFVFLTSTTLRNMYLNEFDSFNELVFNRESVSYMNTLVPSSLLQQEQRTLKDLFSTKYRIEYMKEQGCDYNLLNLEPTTKQKWLSFRQSPPKIKVHLLFASTYPYMTFSKLSHVSLKDKKISIEEFQSELAINKLAGSHYVDTLLYSSIKKSLLFIFHSVRQEFVRRRGTFLFSTVTFKITDKFQVYLDEIEINSDMVEKTILQTEFSEALDLIQELHEAPVAFSSMVKGDKYGSWELLFSEKQESCEQVEYKACKIDKFNVRDLKKANSKVSRVHNTANRLRHEEARILKKMEEQKKAMCRTEKLNYPGTRCDKKHQLHENNLFEEMFREHEKSFNPNQFVMAKPGQVFPWEKV